MSKQKVSIQEQVQKNYPDFVVEVDGLAVHQINDRLAQLAKDTVENEQAKEDDEELERLQAQVTEMAAPYRDAKKALRLKSRYLAALAKEKGGV